jgi:hypothetical protein
MSTRAWFTINELNAWADDYHLKAVKNVLKSVQLSGEPVEIGDVYIANLEHGLSTFESVVKDFELTSKWDKTTGRYIVEKPGKAYK